MTNETKNKKQPKVQKTEKKNKLVERIKRDNDIGARRGILEDLFNDFHTNRWQIFSFNFVRGIFFGFGTVLGGTLLVALTIAVLGQFIDWFPVLGDFIQQIIDAMKK